VTGRISSFGSLGERQPRGNRPRHVRVTRDGEHFAGLLLEWVRSPSGWLARVAYVADEEGTLMVTWSRAQDLTPLAGDDHATIDP